MTRAATLAILASVTVGLIGLPARAAEDVIEHDTYERRSMKVEVAPTTTTMPPSRTYEHHESEETTVERHSGTVATPPPVVRERSTESVETREKN